MTDELVTPLHHISEAAEVLLSQDYGMLNNIQEKFVEAIIGVSRDLLTLVISMSTLSNEAAKSLLSYETRSHLASIIGYAEVLLDGTEGLLTDAQVSYVRQISANGKLVLNYVTNLLES